MKRAPLFLVLLFAGCTRIPEVYAPPMQRVIEEKPRTLQHFVQMGSPEVMSYALADVVPTVEDGGWRWTLQKPKFRFQLPGTQGLQLRIDYVVPDLILKQTGPLRIAVYVEDHLLDTVLADKDGDHQFLKPVPPDWLTTDRPVIVRLELDKIWVSPTDQVRRGIILRRIGFVE